MRRRLLLLLGLLRLLVAFSAAQKMTCQTQGFAMHVATRACERMDCAPRQRLFHTAGRLFCGPDTSACPPCSTKKHEALDAAGCACVSVRACPEGRQWWRDARDAFACGAISSF
jgi:hypothetical protein